MTWITDAMTRDKFSAIRSSLKLLAPIICSVRGRCLELERPTFVSVDEMIIPFRGRSQLATFTSRKPNSHGINVYVLAASEGLVWT